MGSTLKHAVPTGQEMNMEVDNMKIKATLQMDLPLCGLRSGDQMIQHAHQHAGPWTSGEVQ